MSKILEFPEQIIRKCYLCDIDLSIVDMYNGDWDWQTIDGGRHPLCWGCTEKMDDYVQEAMYEAKEQDYDEE